MSPRQDVIAESITSAILHRDDQRKSVLGSVPAFFKIYWLTFDVVHKDLFRTLRDLWAYSEDAYLASLGINSAERTLGGKLKAMKDMGFSGSTFFQSCDSRYIIKSVPRRFEHKFFERELLLPYAEYMQQQPGSLLVRITDFLRNTYPSIGSLLNVAPSHHIVMENIRHGEGEDLFGEGDADWESYDLKPRYFLPECDIAGGALTSQETKDKLADAFGGKLKLTLDQSEELKAQLQKDTAFLTKHNAIDYSLFLIRVPTSTTETDNETAGTAQKLPKQQNWRTGIISTDGKYIYRAVILDFFFSRHSPNAHAFNGLVKAYNLFDKQGPMSITTSSPDYRDRFLKMCYRILEVGQE